MDGNRSGRKVLLSDSVPVFIPFAEKSRDTTSVDQKGIKRDLAFSLKRFELTNANLVNKERKADGSCAIANINNATLTVNNFTNIETAQGLSFQLHASLDNKVPFNLELVFDYLKPQFSMVGSFEKFNFTDLNRLIGAYTPAKINRGIVDLIQFSGMVYQNNAKGTMKFLYHDLNIDLELKEMARWKSDTLAFAANVAVPSANPVSADLPPKIVHYQVERNMNKSFVNIAIKSVLAGLKETVYMSKENRKAYNESKRRAKESRRSKMAKQSHKN